MSKLIKRIWLTIAFAIISFAIVFTLFRGLTPWVGKYRSEIEQRLSQMLGENVRIGAMQTGWYWFEPVVKLKDVVLVEDHQPKITLGQLFIGLDIPRSLWNWQWRPGIFAVKDLRLSVQQTANGWTIKGLGSQRQGSDIQYTRDTEWAIHWIVNQQQTRIEHAQIRMYLKDGSILPFDDVNLLLRNHNNQFTIKADARMEQTVPGSIALQGTFRMDNTGLHIAKGSLYLSVDNLLPQQWQALLPTSSVTVASGVVTGQFWLNIENAQLSDVQSTLSLKNLVLMNSQNESQIFLQSLAANLFFQQQEDTIQIAADQVNLRVNSRTWPENKLLLEYRKKENGFRAEMRYFDASLFHSLMMLSGYDNTELAPMILQGKVQHLRLYTQKGHMQHLFGQFSNIGWHAFSKWPEVTGLSGVLQLDENKGRMRLDTKDLSVRTASKPEIRVNALTAEVGWNKTATDSLAITFNDVNLQHSNLQVNSYGKISNITAAGSPLLDLHGRFRIKDAEFWKSWLPVERMKPKLYHWLIQDVKKVPNVVGSFDIKGAWENFPFDKKSGIFRMEMAGQDAELAVAPAWPTAHALNGTVVLEGRTIYGSIYHGWFGTVLVKALNLKVENLGLDKEILTLHTRIHSTAQKMMDYILQTPLQERLQSLKTIQTTGKANIDLQVEVPFFESPEHILVLGDLQLSENTFTVAFDGLPLNFSQVNGAIQFDQKGILDSQLDVNFWNIPLQVRMHSSHEKKPALVIAADFPLDISALQRQWESPWWKFLNGGTQVHADMQVTEDPDDLDRLRLHSTLQGLKINLPSPFSKTAAADSPLDMSIDFNPHKGFYVKTQWSRILGTHLWFALQEGQINLQKGEIRLGSTHASSNVEQGVQMLGHLTSFDDRQWRSVTEAVLQNPTGTSLWSNIDFVDVLIDNVHWFGQNLTKVNLQAKHKASLWTIDLQEAAIKAQMRWDTGKNALDLHANRLQIPSNRSQRSSPHWPEFSPKDFPRLNLRVDHVFSGKTELGRLSLQGQPVQQQWILKHLNLDTNEYQLRAEGKWQQKSNGQESRINMGLTTRKLSSILARFGYPDVVQAKRGFVAFTGNWPGPIYDPQPEKIRGELSLSLSNGVIDELSKETEEKIGLGKMLSIFSLQTIPRRLRLDFSDLSNPGYTFDKMSAKLRLSKGVLSTREASVNGPVAHASMKGNFDLKTKTCDLKLQVTPHITASLPIVATIAGGPIAGAVTWIVNKIVSREMEKVTSYTYLVKGPWAHPEVVQGDIMKQRKR